MLSLLLLCAVWCACAALAWRAHMKKTRHPLPPALSYSLPIIGHTPIIVGDTTKLWPILKFISKECMEKGGVVTAHIGTELYYLITDRNDALTAANACMQKHFFYNYVKTWLGEGLFTSSGELWQRHRKLLNPAFTVPVIHNFLGIFNVMSKQLVNDLEPHVGKGPFELSQYVRLIAFQTFIKTAFGIHDGDVKNFAEKYMDSSDQIMNLIVHRFQRIWLHNNFIYKLSGLKKKEEFLIKTLDDMANQGNHGTNLLKHMKKHPVQYKLILQENSAESEEHVEGNRKKISKQDLEMKLMDECINLVTTCGRPLTLIDDKPFQNILDMARTGCSHSPINSHKIREATQNKADNLRDDIASKIKKKLISLKLDIASCHLRSFLGINVQFIENDQIIIKTLSVTELTQRHIAEFLKDQLIYVLYRFKISISQIYSITTDNGANMLKMVRLVEQALKTSIQENEDDSDGDDNEIMEITSDEVNFILEDYLESEHYTVAAVRCAAHTLQLAVQDALGSESSPIQTMLTNAREVIKKLRTTVYQHLLKRMGAKKPVVDCPTRWSSTYDMLTRLLELRPICIENYELYLSETTWSSIEVTIASLKPSKILTKKLQMEQLAMGDFYLNWINCKIELKAINTTLACELHRNMEIREKVLFESKAFVAAVYMDPRVNFLLTSDQLEIAENVLVSAWMRWRKLNEQDRVSTVFSSPVASTSTQQQNEGSQLEDFLNESYNNTLRGDPSYGCAGDDSDIKINLKEFVHKQVRLPPSKNIFLFWESKKNILPDLYILSKIVLAAPSTQVSVERLFSSLNFVFNKLRTKLKSDLIDDILFLRNNSENETV